MFVLTTDTVAHKNARSVAIVTDGALAIEAEKKILADFGNVVVLDEFDRDALSELPLDDSVPAIHLRGVSQSLETKDLPVLNALEKRTRILVTGGPFAHDSIREWWKGPKRRVYDESRARTPGQKEMLEGWIAEQTGLSRPLSNYAARVLGHDAEACVSLVRRLRYLDTSGFSSSEVDLFCVDLAKKSVVESIVFMEGRKVLDDVAMLTQEEAERVLLTLPRRIVPLLEMYSVVLRYPKPSVEASKELRMPITTLSRYWPIAARYNPSDVVYRLALIKTLVERSPRDRRALTALIAMW